MKNIYKTFFLLLSVLLLAAVGNAQYEHCGNDYNCYYETKAKIEQEQQLEDEIREERYRQRKLQLEERQLQEVEEQTEILEQQVEEQPYESDMPPVEAP